VATPLGRAAARLRRRSAAESRPGAPAFRPALADAALVLGNASHALDYDDTDPST
jgi:hypothetical protein